MQIEKNKVVSIDYTLKNDDGKILDTSEGREPLNFIHGIGHLIPGLEEALEGKIKDDKLNVSIPPEKGYGLRSEEMIHTVDKSNFEKDAQIEVGMQFQAQMEQGVQLLTVVKVEDDKVTLDGNHPLADQTLHFDVDVKEVREATAEELEHGHVHGPGGHKH
jgi:FKBP-type peptidyl-prolyl cis-trans isomerase SlyD